jgi:hypothetical protein
MLPTPGPPPIKSVSVIYSIIITTTSTTEYARLASTSLIQQSPTNAIVALEPQPCTESLDMTITMVAIIVPAYPMVLLARKLAVAA